jgi:glycosyltransferase involved in cell wall biosynthesis
MSLATTDAKVSVIIPTTALARRRALVWRAVNSILNQIDICAVPIVIVNGPNCDRELMRELEADRRVRVHVVEEAGLANALQVGRRLVDTPWFAELDDDDLLIPGALAPRVKALIESDHYDCVVTNGYRRYEGRDSLNIPDMNAVARDPITSFWGGNWLLPGSYLCRSDRIGPDIFDGMPNALECSFIALRLATSYRIKFLEQPTVVWHQDTPGSLSKSREYMMSLAEAHERLLMLDLPRHARRKIHERITWQYHDVSDLYFREGLQLEAWRWHLRSLVRRGGHRYLPYTRRLIWQAIAPKRGVASGLDPRRLDH